MKKLFVFTLLLQFINSMMVTGSQNGDSNSSSAPGFQLIASLITLGIIAFIAPFLKKDKNTESQ